MATVQFYPSNKGIEIFKGLVCYNNLSGILKSIAYNLNYVKAIYWQCVSEYLIPGKCLNT